MAIHGITSDNLCLPSFSRHCTSVPIGRPSSVYTSPICRRDAEAGCACRSAVSSMSVRRDLLLSAIIVKKTRFMTECKGHHGYKTAEITLLCHKVHRVRKKRGHVIFNYNSRIFWSIFIIFVLLETGVNT